MRNGYIFVIMLALFIAVSRTLYSRIYVTKNIYETSLGTIFLQFTILFLAIVVPGIFIAIWYYKKKDKY